MEWFTKHPSSYRILFLTLFELLDFDHRSAPTAQRVVAWLATFLAELVLMVIFGAHSVLYEGNDAVLFTAAPTPRNRSDPLTQTMGFFHVLKNPWRAIPCTREGGCGKSFSSPVLLRRHLSYPSCLAAHRRRPCPQCNKRVVQGPGRLQTDCTCESTCAICQFHFFSRDSFTRHVRYQKETGSCLTTAHLLTTAAIDEVLTCPRGCARTFEGSARGQLYEFHVESAVRYGCCNVYLKLEEMVCDCLMSFQDSDDPNRRRRYFHHVEHCDEASPERKANVAARVDRGQAARQGPASTTARARPKPSQSKAKAKATPNRKATDPVTGKKSRAPLPTPAKKFYSRKVLTVFACDGCDYACPGSQSRSRDMGTHVSKCRLASDELKKLCEITQMRLSKPIKPSDDRLSTFKCPCGRDYTKSGRRARDFCLHVEKCSQATAAIRAEAKATYRARKDHAASNATPAVPSDGPSSAGPSSDGPSSAGPSSGGLYPAGPSSARGTSDDPFLLDRPRALMLSNNEKAI